MNGKAGLGIGSQEKAIQLPIMAREEEDEKEALAGYPPRGILSLISQGRGGD